VEATPQEYVLEKWLWTEADFDQMGWHDSHIHAVAFLPEQFEVAFDIDYILQWVKPSEDQYYRFWIAPATLVFENIHDLKFDLEPFDAVEIADLHREDPQRPINADYVRRDIEWRWRIETHQGDVTLRSIGYKQYIRRQPVFSRSQSLDLATRGEFSFHRGRDSISPTV
jgi:hypothetical protein